MTWKITAAVLFVDDLESCTRFYRDILGFSPTFSDDVSVAFRVDEHDLVLLTLPAAADMITEEAVSISKMAGHRVLLCAQVADVRASYQALLVNGLVFLKPPKDQAWGRCTAYFADPEGNLWELWHALEAA
ncbi:MAG TPA: VOC family protein [Candidatus Limnocylindrales bacterium]|nr:VOC family protein [Candidatus Limnocylindrales bacterium]